MAYEFKVSAKRSNLMRKIKSEKTTPEILLYKALRKEKIRFKSYYSSLPGKPDAALIDKKIAIFVDGEFWHGYKWREKKKKLKANRNYWIPKIERNIARDKLNNKELKKCGWRVIRFWQYQIIKDLPICLKKIEKIRKVALK
ncbi:MAG: very short patch repair endonuclease [Candidatus Omnitrophica bacterium]|nr:very short patch repair endonuclease [Candidatus Omnitrophota bacterium]